LLAEHRRRVGIGEHVVHHLIAKLAKLEGAELNEAKKILATEATALVHGRGAADRAAETARATFEQGLIAASLPTIEVSRAELEKASEC
jgi:tyrosyl-tRNA synthetase